MIHPRSLEQRSEASGGQGVGLLGAPVSRDQRLLISWFGFGGREYAH